MHALVLTALVFGLFSTGAGGRHDWMRFHSDQVPCPLKKTIAAGLQNKHRATFECPGTLKWTAGKQTLTCDSCAAEFAVRLIKTKRNK